MIITIKDPLLVYVHIPKTGGTSLEEWLRKNIDNSKMMWRNKNINHLSFEEILAITKRRIKLDEHYKFSVVRNPYDRAYSIFQDTNRRKPFVKFEDMFSKFSVFHDTMTNFVRGGMDEVLKYEKFPELVQHLKDKFGFEGKPEIFNPNHTVNPDFDVYPIQEFKYAKIYEQNKHWIPIINKVYSDDFRNFDYKMLPW